MTDLRVLSLGAGVQSSTVALMMVEGEIELPDIAIFADTQWEPAAVYEQLGWLESLLPFPVRRVTAGSVRDDALDPTRSFVSIPLFFDNDGKRGQGRRQCTREYKLAPIEQAIRDELGVASLKGKLVEQVIGISWDEAHRMKDPRRRWERFEYPLVDRRMTRADCRRWMRDHGHPEPPRSACLGCPYKSNTEWRELKIADPVGFDDASAFDNAIRSEQLTPSLEGAVPFVHSSLVPLSLVDLRNAEDHGQLSWGDECEGMCGL